MTSRLTGRSLPPALTGQHGNPHSAYAWILQYTDPLEAMRGGDRATTMPLGRWRGRTPQDNSASRLALTGLRWQWRRSRLSVPADGQQISRHRLGLCRLGCNGQGCLSILTGGAAEHLAGRSSPSLETSGHRALGGGRLRGGETTEGGRCILCRSGPLGHSWWGGPISA